MKIHIFGASGSGTTTLGQKLAEKMDGRHLDADNYYWENTNPPFQIKVPLEERNVRIKKDFYAEKTAIISGSMVSWGEEWKSAFDLVVFLYVPSDIRMQRLSNREKERYGELLKTDTNFIKQSNDFLDWARSYDTFTFKGRSLTIHNQWMELLDCPVLRIEGDTTIAERIKRIEFEISLLEKDII